MIMSVRQTGHPAAYSQSTGFTEACVSTRHQCETLASCHEEYFTAVVYGAAAGVAATDSDTADVVAAGTGV